MCLEKYRGYTAETHSFVTDITVSDSEVEHVNNINM